MCIIELSLDVCFFFFFKQKTAYEMRISDWSSDVCSSDLRSETWMFDYIIVGGGSAGCLLAERLSANPDIKVCLLEAGPPDRSPLIHKIGRASCRERGCQYV